LKCIENRGVNNFNYLLREKKLSVKSNLFAACQACHHYDNSANATALSNALMIKLAEMTRNAVVYLRPTGRLRAKICCFHLKTSNYPPC
jgi:hypothetical protein